MLLLNLLAIPEILHYHVSAILSKACLPEETNINQKYILSVSKLYCIHKYYNHHYHNGDLFKPLAEGRALSHTCQEVQTVSRVTSCFWQ